MKPIAPEVWLRLASERPIGDALQARLAAPEITQRIVAALDSEGKRHLLVRLRVSEATPDDRLSRGIGVTTRNLAMPDHGDGRYLDITCHDDAGHDAFNLIGGEIAAQLDAGPHNAPRVVAQVLAKWRRFWGQALRPILPRDQQSGLFAEIWFLSRWLAPQVGPPEAVHRWRGPFGARHDFESPLLSVEVKASTATRGVVHYINGLEQLVPPEHGALHFFSMRLHEEGGAANTLSILVAECRALLETHAEAAIAFDNALAEAGYSPMHESDYDRIHLRIVGEALYRVEDNFPRITPAVFKDGVPSGI
ncbi:MAG: PD-(D/E)XK motif protein, partial [Gammaproteobacteria bacterium]|nr:PD-(D/E)XK motif protein [Gammaproteobacteria bacterium]